MTVPSLAIDPSALLAHAGAGLFECDATGLLRYVNPSYARLVGRTADALIGQCYFFELLDAGGAGHGAGTQQAWRQALSQGRSLERECAYGHPDGRLRTVLQAVVPLADGSGFVGTVMDASALVGEVRNAWYAQHHDAATRLPNLFLLEERLGLIARRRTVMLMAVGLDDVGTLPRAPGLPEWEAALRLMAERLRPVGGEDGLVAHLGAGEFFVVVGAGAQRRQAPQEVLTRLRAPLRLEGHLAYPRISIGVYETDAHQVRTHAPDLIRRAHLALARARERGGNVVEAYSHELAIAQRDRWQLASDLAQAIERRELWLEFQPEVCLETGRVMVVEALARWQHPVRGLISPGLFAPVAEVAGLADVLGEWVLEQACRAARQWQTRYRDAPRVAVNVSPLQFRDGSLAELVQDVLARTELPAHCLELEITEGVLMEGGEAATHTLQALRALGVGVVLDDFGTGYSSLDYLARYPVSRLKIDRSFVAGLPQDARSLAIVSAVVAMARVLEIEVTAEGIESPEQADQLRALGCPLGQGFGLARPMPERALRAWMQPRFPA